MLAFTIYQPWASLVMVGAKPHEFRNKSYLDKSGYLKAPKPGERIVVQASVRKVRPREIDDLLERLGTSDDQTGLVPDLARPLLERLQAAPKCQGVLQLGAGLGTAVIGEPILACDLYKLEVADSDRGKFNWAWPLSDVQRWDVPVPCRGMQGFWNWPFAIAEAA